MKQKQDHSTPERKQRGQSLVEVALFLPILIIIIAGVVEVSQLLITQNRVTTASRAAARFGSNGGENEGMRRVIMNNVTQTLDLNEALWDIWVVRGQIDETGSFIEDWEFNHIYGISNTVRFDVVDEDTLQQRILDELSVDGRSPAELRFVGNYVQHDVNTILGLNALPGLDSYNSVSSLNVMRIVGEALEVTKGCDAFPIAVHHTIRSVTPPGTGGNPYPTGNELNNSYPSPFPLYESFTRHRPDTPLEHAREGDIFFVQQGFGSGNFGWLNWNTGINASAQSLGNSLTWPGNSQDYEDHNDGGQPVAAGIGHVVRGFVDVYDNTDLSMNIGNWVSVKTGNVNSAGSAIEPHVDRGRELRLVVWDEAADPGVNGKYQIAGFAVFKLHGFKLTQSGSGSWILAEFIRWDNSCGQE